MIGRKVIQSSLGRIVLTLGIVAAVATLAHAQGPSLRARVPFAFHVGNSVFQAGGYALRNLGSDVIRIGSPESNTSALVFTTPTRGGYRLPPRLVFHRNGEKYFLATIDWGDGRAHELPNVPNKREIAETVPPRIVVVALK